MNREEVFTTNIGACVSIVSLLFLGLISTSRTINLFEGEDPFFSMSDVAYGDETIDLWALQFMFAVEDIDPKLGRIEVYQVHNGYG